VYSFAHDVRAYLVEYSSGLGFAEYCRRNIFQPLGMKDTVFGIPPELVDRYPTHYTVERGGALRALTGQEDHYTRFAQMLLNGGELNGVRILGRKTVELMTSDSLPTANVGWARGIRYGLGVSVLSDPALTGNPGSKGAFGWSGHATTWVGIDPREDLVALLFAQDMPKDSAFVAKFQALVYQAL
jgi:CubicO group peptidase (beta-lactamase class C family)